MPEKEQQEKTLSKRLVKEAVGKGMDSPLRDEIVEAVEEAEGETSDSKPALPLVGALVGLGAALGYLAGRQQGAAEEAPLEDVDEPEIIEEFGTDEPEAETGEAEAADSEAELEEAEGEESGRKLPRLVLALSALAGIALLRRRLKSDESEEWEPIEEFEPAVDAETDEEDEGEEEEAAEDEESDAEEAETEE